MTRTRRDPFPLFLQRLLIAESKERGVFSDSRRRSCGSCWNMVPLWKSGLASWQSEWKCEKFYIWRQEIAALKLCFDCCVLCMENSKEVFLLEINRNMKKIHLVFSFSDWHIPQHPQRQRALMFWVYDEERLHFSTQISRMAVSL